MNKKFFAALASATMAFSTTGSLAVFADDFTDEVAPVLPGTPAETPTVTEVVWNEENFGDLAVDNATGNTVNANVTFTDKDGNTINLTLDRDNKVDTAQLANITKITLATGFNGEIEGLEYFTGLKNFEPAANANPAPTVTNTALDFSKNTALNTLSVNAPNLRHVVLPEAAKDDDGKETYNLASLTLTNTKLLSVDLTEQTGLATIVLTDGMLQDIQLPSNAKTTLRTLDLSKNMLESVNLPKGNALTSLTLGDNHIGTIENTPAGNGVTLSLGTQTLYVAENSASVNLLEMFPDFDFGAVTTATTPATAFETKNGNKTGVFKLDETTGEGSYTYNGMTVNIVAANPMYRLYNPNSGEHFYTKDAAEQEALVTLGWNDEGYGWVAPKDKNGKEVYRLYNPNAGDHHYTVDPIEKEALVAAGWKYEGIGWYSATNATTPVTVYRQYNPNAKAAGAHNYTMDLAENDYLVSVGWTPEGKAWLALK